MIPEHNPNLEQWLSKVTKNLAPQAISSITKEITDHFQTSLESYERRGISRIEAKDMVLRDLGDADKSATKFNRAYLTIKDEESLRYIVGKPALLRSILMILGSLLPFYVASSLASLNINNVIRDLNRDLKFHIALNSKEYLLALNGIIFLVTISFLILFPLIDLIIIRNQKSNNLRILIEIKKMFILAGFIFSIAKMISWVAIFGLKGNFYMIPGMIGYFGLFWIKNDYPVLRKLSTRAST